MGEDERINRAIIAEVQPWTRYGLSGQGQSILTGMIDLALFRRILAQGLVDWRIWLAVPVLAVLTYGAAHLGIDAAVNQIARLQAPGLSIAWSAFPMLAGIAVPMLCPVFLAIRGERDLATRTAGALVLSLIVVSLLKGTTSRVHPEALEPVGLLAKSQSFRFGLLQSGLLSLVEGWPSGHAATNGAVGLVLARLSLSRSVRAAAYGWIAWVTLATVFGISGDVHWLSDTIAGIAVALLAAWAVLRAT